jgi:hypothetical protein
MACYLITEVDSVLPTDPVAPSSTGHRFYLAMSECGLCSCSFDEARGQRQDVTSPEEGFDVTAGTISARQAGT